MADKSNASILPELLRKYESTILESWTTAQKRDAGSAVSRIGAEVLRAQSHKLLNVLQRTAQATTSRDIHSGEWQAVRDSLSDILSEQARAGASPTQVATFVFSLKEPVFDLLYKDYGSDPVVLAKEVLYVSLLLDKFGLYTTEEAIKKREEQIGRQQTEMLELSTPVVKLWDGILALPLIGTLDSSRTGVVMESLLEEIVRTGASIAIVDITGVPTVDTLVAQHLLKTVAAARLMGAECIISGIRPQIASTIVHLGVDLGDVITKATLADAFRIALQRNEMQVVSKAKSGRKAADE